jgi:SAM-dependent methyltransferase
MEHGAKISHFIMQTKEELELWYQNSDPWAYKITKDDLDRRHKICKILESYLPYERALDIGCGEGFVTEHIRANVIHGIEISDKAAKRFSSKITRVHEPDGKYDLVTTTGTMYPQYNHQQIYDWVMNSAARIILIAGIKDWLIPYKYGKILYREEFTYREYVQQVTVYEYLGENPMDGFRKIELE